MAKHKVPTSQKHKVPTSHRFTGSSNVDSARWDPTHHTITVEFTDGRRWVYRDVPEHVWLDFTRTGSAGHFVNEELRNTYRGGPG